MIGLPEALGRFNSTAIVGAGGKTSALFRLARGALAEQGGAVFLANSAHLSLEQTRLAERIYQVEKPEELPDFAGGIPPGLSLFCGAELPGRGRVQGLAPDVLDGLRRRAGYHAVPLFIEADGARGRALKAPAEHEPPIPPWVDAVIVCAGLSGLGRPLAEESVFRAELFARLSGLALGEPVSAAGLARVLTQPDGGLKNIPPGARKIALLNQADTPADLARAAGLARELLPEYSAAVVAALHGPGPASEAALHAVYRPNAGIVLAAGAARRFGRPKQVLEWQGQPLVRRAALAALEGGLAPVVVVSGCAAREVEAALDGLAVEIVRCADWQAGQSASLKAGLRRALELRPDLDGAAFLLSDQPFVTGEVVRALSELRARTLGAACAPRAGGRRCNPVLFGRSLFPRLLALEGDAGGRQILQEVELETLEWPDARLGLDIDTQEDFARIQIQGDGKEP